MSEADSPVVLFRRAPQVKERSRLRRFARRLSWEAAGGALFTCLVTDDRELERLNAQFLGKPYATDVLSFPAAEAGAGAALGEIAISADRAAAQAAAHGHSLEDEIEILMLHGVLHLFGMDHEKDRGRMARVEQGWRRRLGLPGSLIARSRR